MKENRLIVGDKSWADTIPEWLLDEVRAERLIYGLVGLINPDAPRVGDAELCVYLYTASLRAPMYDEHNQIYIYLVAKLMRKQGKELQDFMQEKLDRGLSLDEERELKDLKDMIYSRRGGDINHPVLNFMREWKKEIDEEKRTGQRTLES